MSTDIIGASIDAERLPQRKARQPLLDVARHGPRRRQGLLGSPAGAAPIAASALSSAPKDDRPGRRLSQVRSELEGVIRLTAQARLLVRRVENFVSDLPLRCPNPDARYNDH